MTSQQMRQGGGSSVEEGGDDVGCCGVILINLALSFFPLALLCWV